jgi:hypothetical protein
MRKLIPITALALSALGVASTASASVPALNGASVSVQKPPSGEVAIGEIRLIGNSSFCLTVEQNSSKISVSRCTGDMAHPGERQGWAIARFIGLATIHPLTHPGWCLGFDLPSDDAMVYDCSGDDKAHNPIIMEIHDRSNGGNAWTIANPQGKLLSADSKELVFPKWPRSWFAPVYFAPERAVTHQFWELPTDWISE